MPQKHQLAAFYPPEYWWKSSRSPLPRLEGFYRRIVLADHVRVIMSAARKLNRGNSRPRLLEIGCGAGALLRLLKNRGFEVAGVDSSHGAAEIASVENGVSVVTGYLQDAGFPAGSFDIVALFHVVEHLTDPHDLLREIHRILSPSGRLLLQAPNLASWQARLFGARWCGLDVPRHVINYSESALRRLLNDSSFSIRRIRHFNLRDNAAAAASSLFPSLDPIRRRNIANESAASALLRSLLYFAVVVLAQPFALLEAAARAGGTVMIEAEPSPNPQSAIRNPQSPLVSVIVVNFNRRELLRSCLESLWAQTYSNYEVIVVDNGSHDGSVEFLKSIAAPKLRIVELPMNRGFAGGCNAGIQKAVGRYVATLNNDAEAHPRWLEEMVGVMESDPAAGMCASKILFQSDRSRIDKVGHLMYWDGLNHGRGSGETDDGQYEAPDEVLFPDGAAALYRRQMLDEIGLFDERFFAYGDDADLGLRGRLAGWSCRYAPAAVAYHARSATAGEFSSLKAFLIERNRLFVAVKTLPLPLLIVSPFLTALRFAFHAYGALFRIGSSGRFAAGSSRCRLLLAILRAYWSGMKHLPGMWRSRRKIRSAARLRDSELVWLLWKHRIKLRTLTLGS